MKVAQLKKECTARGVSIAGLRKAGLAEALAAALEEEEQEAAANAPKAPKAAPKKRKRGAAAVKVKEEPEAAAPPATKRAERRDKLLASGACGARNCTCWRALAAADVDAALAAVRSARAFGGATAGRGPLNDARTLRAVVEDLLAHSRQSEALKAQQVRLREALRRVGARLGIGCLSKLNTKTTPYRTLGKALWDGCGLAKPAHPNAEAKARQKADGEEVDAIIERLATRFPAGGGGGGGGGAALPPLELSLPATAAAAAVAKATLLSRGAVLLPAAVPVEVCCALLAQVAAHVGRHTPTRLTETMALGRRGSFFHKNWALPELRAISDAVVRALGLRPTDLGEGGDGEGEEEAGEACLPATNTKSVLLCYAEGAENWSHQDDNKDYPYQALLMLSDPGVDFQGGELHVLDGGRAFARTTVAFAARGDVVVFRSNGHFFHGMDEVRRGSAAECSRVAVGLLHRLA